ncbi:TetR/AcrR family transcriptional regulator [Mammaliicoccus sp. H-M34]|uniref:TetR/AcrR family transcriptional regulator n=1 Tax=Mammaliicoccus sp. H-M34 TaxID=2898693 RepID=UPI001EFA3039|nr:TetR/AcrR family transcriptional regulator [Mammaliicoccus sp. H-M34]
MKKHARQLITSNMVYLLEHYHFEEITIKMLCAECGINRSTFYAHFKDKYETYEEIKRFHMMNYETLMDNIERSIIDNPDDRRKYVKQYFTNVFYYIAKHQRFFTSVFVAHPERELIISFISLLKTRFAKLIHSLGTLEEVNYFLDYTVGGQIASIYSWLKNGCEETPEKMADIMYRNIIKINR